MDRSSRRGLLRAVRTVHIHLSIFASLFFLFFALTGFVLHHGGFFGLDSERSRRLEGALPVELCAGPDRLGIVEALRAALGEVGPVTELSVSPLDVSVQFRRPGRAASVVVDRADGRWQGTLREAGLLAVLTRLHTGEDAGPVGSLLIQLAAVLALLSTLSGLWLWTSLTKRRSVGLAMLALAGSLAAGVVWVLVL